MRVVKLTKRQTQVALLLSRGYTPAQVCNTLNIKRNTVYHHLNAGKKITKAHSSMQHVSMVAIAHYIRKSNP